MFFFDCTSEPVDYYLSLETLKAIKLPVTFEIKWLGNEVLNLIFEQITLSSLPKPAFLFQDYILQAFSFVGQLFKALFFSLLFFIALPLS